MLFKGMVIKANPLGKQLRLEHFLLKHESPSTNCQVLHAVTPVF